MAVMRDRIHQFRLTENELWLVQQAAAVAGLRPSDWSRQVVLQAAMSLVSNKDSKEVILSMNSTGQVKYVDTSG